MYDLRSRIIHGSELMQLDQDLAFGWDPPWWNERELNEELWKLTQTAARNWLKAQPTEEYFRVVKHILDRKGDLAERAVLSGQHRTLNAALAALELETAKNPAWQFDPETNQWRVADGAGRSQLLMVDPF
jgi:hypothetical protein